MRPLDYKRDQHAEMALQQFLIFPEGDELALTLVTSAGSATHHAGEGPRRLSQPLPETRRAGRQVVQYLCRCRRRDIQSRPPLRTHEARQWPSRRQRRADGSTLAEPMNAGHAFVFDPRDEVFRPHLASHLAASSDF